MGQKKRQRTAMLETQQINRYVLSLAQKDIRECDIQKKCRRFNELVQQGVIVEEREEDERKDIRSH